MGNMHLHQAVQHYERGVAAASEGRVSEALAAFTRAAEIEPTFLEAVAGKGTALAQLERYDEALATLAPLWETDPGNPLVLYGMALAYLGLDENEKAYDLLSWTVEDLPDDPDLLFSFARLFAMLGYPKDAADLFEKIVTRDPTYLDAHIGLGHALAQMGEIDDAVATMRKAVEIAPENDTAHFSLAMTLLLAGEFHPAAKVLRRALALNDQNAFAHAALSEVLIQLGKEREALAESERALRLAPDEPHILFCVAQTNFANGRLAEAKELLARLLEVDPEDHQAHALLTQIASLEGDDALVQRELDYLRKADPALAALLKDHLQSESPKTRRKAAKAPAADSSAVYQLKITLRGLRPPIWRRVLAPAKTTLARLHDIIQIAMGWTNSHLHVFTADGVEYSDSAFHLGDGTRSEKRATLAQVAPVEKSRITYLYDFGDGWEHEVLVEKILPADPNLRHPVCVKGKRNGPLEDVGGVWGYADYLEAINDPAHPDHEEMREWHDEPHDPDAFDIEGINARLARLR